MDIDLILQNNPNLLPRDEVRITALKADPYPDRRRVKVEVDVTPFRERPNLEIAIVGSEGRPVAGSSAVGIMNFKTAYTLHLRVPGDPAGSYTVQVALYYDDLDAPQDRQALALDIPSGTA
jgi:hypothetical protein